jgi:hypothetical protein
VSGGAARLDRNEAGQGLEDEVVPAAPVISVRARQPLRLWCVPPAVLCAVAVALGYRRARRAKVELPALAQRLCSMVRDRQLEAVDVRAAERAVRRPDDADAALGGRRCGGILRMRRRRLLPLPGRSGRRDDCGDEKNEQRGTFARQRERATRRRRGALRTRGLWY